MQGLQTLLVVTLVAALTPIVIAALPGPMTFITATTMPLLIALAVIGLSTGVMLPANVAALVGAGVLSVLFYPMIAIAVARRGRTTDVAPEAAAAGPGADSEGGIVGAARAAGEIGAGHEDDAADDYGGSAAE